MAFLLSNLIQNIYSDLGQSAPNFGLFLATGGSATTFIDTDWNLLENPPEQDAFKNYLAIVVRDSAGASASPEGRWGLVSAYADNTQTGTIATVTDAIGAGDTIMLVKQDLFPLQQVIFCVNRALTDLGDLPLNSDTSLTTVSSQTEYDIPVSVKRGLKAVYYQSQSTGGDNQWIPVHDRRNELTSAGTASILYTPYLPAGYTIRLVYDGVHPVVSAYNSIINEYIHPRVATAAAVLEVLKWYNHRDENQGANEFFLWLEQEYETKKLPLALLENPIPKAQRMPKYFTAQPPEIGLTPETDPLNTGYR